MSNQLSGTFSRRSVLRQVGILGMGGGLVGRASGEESKERERRVVGTESKAAAEKVKRRAVRVVRGMDFGDRGCVVVGEFERGGGAEIESRSDVRYVESETEVKILGRPVSGPAPAIDLDDQLTSWGIDRIGARIAHDRGRTGRETHIAIIDTGIDSDHPDLKANLGEGYAVVECDDSCRRDWDDDHGHGTHCAGIAGAVSNTRGIVGVCPDTTLHAVRVISPDGGGEASDIAEGLRWVADKGYDVASLSLGGTSPSEVMRDAVKYAYDNGVLIVAAAGNEEPDEKTVHYPAAFPEVMSVGAVNADDELAEFSLTGDTIEIVAPGVDILSTVIGGYDRYSGTSMAAPHVSGAAGMLKGAGFPKQETRDRLSDTAEDLGLDDDEQGNGLLAVDAAIGGAGDDGGGGDAGDGFGVSTQSAASVEKTSATLNGELAGLGDHSSATVGFEYWIAGEQDSTKQTLEAGERSSPGSFSATVEGLSSDTTYVVTAFAVSGDVKITGGQIDFTTVANPTDLFTIETGEATDVEEDEAELVGHVTEIHGVDEIIAGFEYWVEGDKEGTTGWIEADDVDDVDDFDEDAEDLESDTTYAFVAVGVAGDVEVRGDPVEFATKGGD